MASLLNWLGKRAKNVENVGRGVVGGAVNTVQIPYSAARVGLANTTGNQTAAANARGALGRDVGGSYIQPLVPFERSIANAALTPVYNHYANQEAQRAQRLLTPTYGANTAAIQAGLIKQNFLNQQLGQSGLTPTDRLSTTIRKIGGQAGAFTANAAMLGELPGVATGSLPARMATFGGLNAATGIAQTAQQQNPNLKDYLKTGAQGAAIGAAFPLAAETIKLGIKTGKKALPVTEVGAVGKNVNKLPLPDNDVAGRMMLDYIKGKPAEKGSALSGEGAQAPSMAPLSAEAKTALMEAAKRKAGLMGNEKGSINLTDSVSPPLKGKPPAVSPTPAGVPLKTAGKGTFNPNEYVKQQTKLQAAAQGKTNQLGQFRSEFATKGLDALSAIEKPVEKAAGGRNQTVTLRNALDRSLRSDTIAGQYAKDNGFHAIVNSIKNTKAFDQYVAAKHAADLEANGIKTGRDLAKDSQLVQALGPKYEAQAGALTAYNNKLLDTTVNYGLLSRETATYLKQKYPNYVPFDRIFTDAELQAQRGNGAGPASLSTQTVIQKIKGSERQIHSPLESILAKTHDVMAQGERNLAAKEIAKTAELPDNPLGLKELKPTETIGNRPTISFLDNGKKRVFETTPEVASAAKSLNKPQLGLVGKILSYPTRVLRLGATGANLPFAAANVVKDTASAFINSQHPVTASVANPKVFLQALSAAFHHGGKQYGELVREGAGGTSFDIARNAAADTIGKIRAERNVGTRTLYTVRHPSELLRAVEDTIGRSEEFGRAKEYFGNKSAALREGKTTPEAIAYGADAARNNTINFARAGEYGRVLNSVLPYFNAGIQGSRTLVRNFRDRPAQTGAKVAISALFPVAVTTAWNLNDPARKAAYDDIQDYEKQGNIIIVPLHPKKDPKTGRWNVIKIPVSQEIANLNSVVRNGVEAFQKDKSIDFPAMAGNLTGTVTSLNTQSPRQLASQITPQAIKPGIEALTNQNLFTGNTIVPDKFKGLDTKDQYGNNTSGTARVLGGKIGVSPFMLDNTIRTTLGGLGQTGVNASDAALAKLGIIKPQDVKGKSIGAGVTSRFSGAQGQSEYAAIDKAIKSNSDKLKATSGYKQMSPDEKAKALDRLKNDVIVSTKQQVDAKNNTGSYAPDYTGKATNLSARQKGLLDGTTDVSSYLTTQSSKASTKVSQKALDDFTKSGKSYQVVGTTVLRRNTDGTATTIPKIKFDSQLNTVTLAQQKKTGNIQGYLDTATKQIQNINQQLKDPSLDPVESITLQNQRETLLNNTAKYRSYGGFTKPKSASGRVAKTTKATASFKTTSAIKAPPKPKGVSVRKLAAPKARATRKLAVSKIPTSYKGKSVG